MLHLLKNTLLFCPVCFNWNLPQLEICIFFQGSSKWRFKRKKKKGEKLSRFSQKKQTSPVFPLSSWGTVRNVDSLCLGCFSGKVYFFILLLFRGFSRAFSLVVSSHRVLARLL